MDPSNDAGTCRFALIKRTSPVVSVEFGSSAPHAGAGGGARNRAMSDRISWNICRPFESSSSARTAVTPAMIAAGDI